MRTPVVLTEDQILEKIIQHGWFLYSPEYWCDRNDSSLQNLEELGLIIHESLVRPETIKHNGEYTYIAKETT